jgi:hypothetical protein
LQLIFKIFHFFLFLVYLMLQLFFNFLKFFLFLFGVLNFLFYNKLFCLLFLLDLLFNEASNLQLKLINLIKLSLPAFPLAKTLIQFYDQLLWFLFLFDAFECLFLENLILINILLNAATASATGVVLWTMCLITVGNCSMLWYGSVLPHV